MDLRERVTEVAEELEGTCQDLSDVATDEEMADAEFCKLLDLKVFCCVQCDWWASVDEAAQSPGGELVCSDCNGDDDD